MTEVIRLTGKFNSKARLADIEVSLKLDGHHVECAVDALW